MSTTPAQLQHIYLDGRHYDEAYREFAEDVPFWLAQADKFGGPILELACGTGRIALPLARRGFEVVGIDLAGSMLDQARRMSSKENLSIQWVRADMRDFHVGRKFNQVIVPSQSISRMLARQDLEQCLSCVKAHLEPRGRFIIELYNPSLELLSRDENERYPFLEYPHPSGEGTVTVTYSGAYDRATQVQHLTLYYSLPRSSEPVIEQLSMRMYFPQELEALLVYNRFDVEAKFGDYDAKPFDADDQLQILVCRKVD